MKTPYRISTNYVLDLPGDGCPEFLKHRSFILAAGGEMLLIGCPGGKTVRLRVTRKLSPPDIAQLISQHRARAVMYRITKLDTSNENI
jgi:hypothetical protein